MLSTCTGSGNNPILFSCLAGQEESLIHTPICTVCVSPVARLRHHCWWASKAPVKLHYQEQPVGALFTLKCTHCLCLPTVAGLEHTVHSVACCWGIQSLQVHQKDTLSFWQVVMTPLVAPIFKSPCHIQAHLWQLARVPLISANSYGLTPGKVRYTYPWPRVFHLLSGTPTW